jgi:putative flippase GtrA
MTRRAIAVRYAAFAIVATIGNLAAQRVILQFEETGAHFTAAVGAGTLVGLVIKYELDRRWIFYATESGVRSHSRTFTLYTIMGVVTTVIFWGTETAFWLVWQTDVMRELGAVLGLSVGYLLKYNLDRRFVFPSRRLAASS